MKSKQEFFDEFFLRLQKEGLTVNILPQSDVAAEISDGNGLPFCAVTMTVMWFMKTTTPTRCGYSPAAPQKPVKKQAHVRRCSLKI